MSNLREKILDLFFPRGLTCNGCGAELTDRDDRFCEFCNHCLGYFRKTDEPKRRLADVDVFSLYRYDAVRDIVLDCKDNDKPHLAISIGRILYRFYCENNLRADVVFYVPCDKKHVKKRGYDHMKLVAEEFAKQAGLPMGEGLLRVKESPDQASVDAKSRYENVKDCFAYKGEKPIGKEVLLLDDVVTTGATLTACINALRTAFPMRIVGLTLGRAGN